MWCSQARVATMRRGSVRTMWEAPLLRNLGLCRTFPEDSNSLELWRQVRARERRTDSRAESAGGKSMSSLTCAFVNTDQAPLRQTFLGFWVKALGRYGDDVLLVNRMWERWYQHP